MPKPKSVKHRGAKKTRAPRGSGSVFPDHRRGGWVAKVPTGRKNGKLTYTRVTGATQAEVVEKRKLVVPLAASSSLADWCARWLGTLDHLKPQSADEYEIAVRLRIEPQLGHLRLDEITPLHIEDAARAWAKAVGANTILKTLGVLSGALQAAHRGDLVTRNAARPARKPSAPKTDIDPFAPAELVALIRAGAEHPEYRAFAALAATGMRVGEAIALGPGAYNSVTGKLTISRTKTKRHGYGSPKSERSARTISVPLLARPVFALGIPASNYQTTFGRWTRLLAHLGFRARNIHQVRHSVATHAIAAGTPIANVARDLGDTVDVIVRTYLHAVDDGRDVCAALDRLYSGE